MARKDAATDATEQSLISPMTEPNDDSKADSSSTGPAHDSTTTDHMEEHGPVSLGADPAQAAAGRDLTVPDKFVPIDEAATADGGGAGAPAPVEGAGRIIEEAPGIGGGADIGAMGDPGDLSSFGHGPGLPDLGIDDGGFGATDPGSTLLDDIMGNRGTDPLDDMFDVADQGWSPPEFEDQSGWAMDGGGFDPSDTSDPPPLGAGSFIEAMRHLAEGDHEAAAEAFGTGVEELHGEMEGLTGSDGEAGSYATAAGEHPGGAGSEDDPIELNPTDLADVPSSQDGSDDDDEDDDGDGRQGDGGGSPDDTPGTQSMPIPPEADDGTSGGGGELDPMAGGTGGDPAPETEESGAGELIGGRGDIDYDPDLEEAGGGTIDAEMLGLGAVDPLEGESSLLSGDTGAVGDLAAESDIGGDTEVDIEMVADADIGEGA